MEIVIGKTAGFCYGVKRAVEGAENIIENANGKKVYCLGEIVHNKDVVNKLETSGIEFIDDLSEVKENSQTIIRAHGVTKNVYKMAENKSIQIKDYTCPNVLKIHEIAEEYSKKGYYIILLGSKKHPENIGTTSFCGDYYSMIEDVEDTYSALEELEKSNKDKLLVISQTTYSLEKFYIIEEIIKNEISKNIEVVVRNTICKATELRQKETEEISKKVDVMVIIGGKNSSNTKKLFEIAKINCKKAICVENRKDLDLKDIAGANVVGIMAGASTPKESIEEIVSILEK